MSDRDPLSEIERAFDVLGDPFGGASVPADVVDEGDSFVVHVDLVAVVAGEIDVQLVENRRLTISAASTEDSELSDGTYVKRERRKQSVERTVRLPEAVEESETAASYENGVLTVTLPKITPETDDGTDIPVN